MAQLEPSGYRFGSFVLEPGREELRNGAEAVTLSRQALAILVCLARNHPHCVRHAELLAAAWLGAAIGGGSLRLAIWEARRALAADPSLCQAIRTVRGKGYRFAVPVVPAAPDPHPSSRPESFVRTDELLRLTEMLEQATSGEGRACAIMGRAGIGKTRLMRELARHALERDVEVWEARGERDRAAPPLWPWVRMLKTRLDVADERTREHFERTAPCFSRFMTSVCSGAAGQHAQLEPSEGRCVLFAEIVRVLAWLSARRPMLLLFDDLQWADGLSQALFAHVVRELRACRTLLVAACRHVKREKNPNAARALEALSQEPLNQRMPLGALSMGAFAHVLTDTVRETVSPLLLERVHRITRGNPRAVQELMLLLSTEGVQLATACVPTASEHGSP